ncbi:ubiquinone/menaquinone biosynthesis C-methylase UbiE [Clostridium beijerinckii]|nr:class I SAM-dependent methyltransferase [Clostridium beijerinckii]NSB22295.1 ubiquinone/menaquinone biosynthesis C-methylase UbiE [Clostridium beijerinckii]
MIKIWNRTFEDMSNWAIEKVDIAESDYILDVGCGGGQTVYNLAKKAKKGQVSGIDISSEAVKSSIEKNKREIENGKVKIYEADVANLPFTSEYFDEITAIQTHIYWDDLKKGLSEIYRVLKIHGQLLIVCEKDKINYHMKSYKENDEMKQLLFEIGFKKITINESGNWIVFICDKD